MIVYIIIKFPFRVSNCTLSERKVHNSIQCVAILFLFRPGGGGGGRLIVPALTLNVYTFYQKQANPPNVVTLPLIYLVTICQSKCLSIKFDATMATTVWHAVIFRILNFHLFITTFHVLLLFSVTFWSILAIFKGSEKIEKSKMADPRWPPFAIPPFVVIYSFFGPRRPKLKPGLNRVN